MQSGSAVGCRARARRPGDRRRLRRGSRPRRGAALRRRATACRTWSPATRCTGCTSSRPTARIGSRRVASVMQSDAEQMDGWWRGQDPTRTPRNDLATFSCGTQLDITTVRSSRSGASLASLADPLSRARRHACARRGSRRRRRSTSRTTTARRPDGNVCGQGGGDALGFGVAVVYYQSCSGVSTAVVAAHEFLHTLGAVATGAPHDCTGDSMGHTCDNDARPHVPLGAEAIRSRPRCSIPAATTTTGTREAGSDAQDSPWLLRLDAQAPLTVNVSGPGSVSADVPGLLCSTAARRPGTRASASC